MEERFIVQTSTPERFFVKVYRDFLNAGLLSGKEQIIFIHLKQYINFTNDEGQSQNEVYPTLATLAKNVKMTEKTVRTVLQSLQKKGILEIRQQGLNRPNIYKINDNAGLWKPGGAERSEITTDETEEKWMIETLSAKGYCISKEKELDNGPVKAHYQASANPHDTANKKDTIYDTKSQAERYTVEDIKSIYGYDSLIVRYREKQIDIDIVFDILYDTLNSQKKTIRIDGEDKPGMVVIGRLMRLQPDDLIYSINKYHEKTERIKNARNYLLTILYHAKEQSYLELMNLGHHNRDF